MCLLQAGAEVLDVSGGGVMFLTSVGGDSALPGVGVLLVLPVAHLVLEVGESLLAAGDDLVGGVDVVADVGGTVGEVVPVRLALGAQVRVEAVGVVDRGEGLGLGSFQSGRDHLCRRRIPLADDPPAVIGVIGAR